MLRSKSATKRSGTSVAIRASAVTEIEATSSPRAATILRASPIKCSFGICLPIPCTSRTPIRSVMVAVSPRSVDGEDTSRPRKHTLYGNIIRRIRTRNSGRRAGSGAGRYRGRRADHGGDLGDVEAARADPGLALHEDGVTGEGVGLLGWCRAGTRQQPGQRVDVRGGE